jgi:hypothetical protein
MTYSRNNGICALSPCVFADDIAKIALLSPGAKNPFRFCRRSRSSSRRERLYTGPTSRTILRRMIISTSASLVRHTIRPGLAAPKARNFPP